MKFNESLKETYNVRGKIVYFQSEVCDMQNTKYNLPEYIKISRRKTISLFGKLNAGKKKAHGIFI